MCLLPLPNFFNCSIESAVPDFCLPRPRSVFTEEEFDFFDRFTGRFGVREEGLDGGGEAEDAEDDECFPAVMSASVVAQT